MIRFFFQRILVLLSLFSIIAVASANAPKPDIKSSVFVSANGNDDNPGTFQEPFASLSAAKNKVAEMKQAGHVGDITVVIREGSYYCPQGLVFSASDGAVENSSVTYRAADGETVKIIGGYKAAGWKKYKGEIRYTQFPDEYEVKQVFEAGKWVEPARIPNDGYFEITGVDEKDAKATFYYDPEDLEVEGWDVSQARVLIWQGEFWSSHWFSQDKGIKSHDPERNSITMDSRGGYDMNRGNEYFIYNVLEELDRPGECFIDNENKRVYIWPQSNEPVENLEIVLSTAKNVVAVKGSADNPVSNLHFEGIDFSACNDDAMSFEAARDCSVKFCKVENGGRHGISLLLSCQNIEVYGCEITGHGFNGVDINGGGFNTTEMQSHHNVIENNHIHHCGRLVGHGRGVGIAQSGFNKVLHNHIHHMPRYGISIKGLRFHVLKEQVKEVTWENHYDYLHSRNNLIAYNHVHHVNMKTQDTGAFESWGPGRDNIYDHNLIHDVGISHQSIISGIYCDDATDYFTITNNIVYGVRGIPGSQCMLVKGIGSKISNNILIVETNNCAAIRTFEMADEANKQLEFTKNIVYFEKTEPQLKDMNGNIIEWRFELDEAGTCDVWFLYSANLYWTGRAKNMLANATTISFDNGEPVKVEKLPDTDSWFDYEWIKVARTELSAGQHLMRWHNPYGGGANIKRICISTDPGWSPKVFGLNQRYVNGTLLVKEVDIKPYYWRSIYEFNNWDPQRFAVADKNLFFKHGDQLVAQNIPGEDTYANWVTVENNKYDQNSIIADPMFVDAENHDYRLKPESPAFKLGFQQIDIESIGLKDDFPARLARE